MRKASESISIVSIFFILSCNSFSDVDNVLNNKPAKIINKKIVLTPIIFLKRYANLTFDKFLRNSI